MSTFPKNSPLRPVTFIGVSLGTLLFLFNPALADRCFSEGTKSQLTAQNPAALTVGTKIPVRYDRSHKILLTKEESFALTLIVANNIKNQQGRVIIPDGSQIVGEIKPSGQGSRFLSQKLLIFSREQPIKVYSFDAVSQWLERVQTLIKGVNPDELIKGATLSQAAAGVIAAIKGEQSPHNSQDILPPAGLEALAGWLLTGERIELLSIVPERDLTLTLQSEFLAQ